MRRLCTAATIAVALLTAPLLALLGYLAGLDWEDPSDE